MDGNCDWVSSSNCSGPKKGEKKSTHEFPTSALEVWNAENDSASSKAASGEIVADGGPFHRSSDPRDFCPSKVSALSVSFCLSVLLSFTRPARAVLAFTESSAAKE